MHTLFLLVAIAAAAAWILLKKSPSETFSPFYYPSRTRLPNGLIRTPFLSEEQSMLTATN